MTQRVAAPQDEHTCPPGCLDSRVAHKVIEASSDLAFVVEKDGTVGEVVTGAEAQGWAGLVGKRLEESAAIDSRSKVQLLLQEARAAKASRAREMNLQVEGGPEVPFRFSAVALGTDERVVVLGRDLRPVAALQQQMIGIQQAMDREFERMRQAETRYRLLFQVSGEAVVVLDAATLKVVEANPAAAALWDEAAQALQGRPMQELVAPRDWPTAQAQLAAAAAGGHPPDLDLHLPGSRSPTQLSVSAFRQSGALLLLVRLRPESDAAADTRAAARTGRVMAVMEKLPDGFVVIGEDRRILLANAAFCDLVQQTGESQVVGQPLDRWLGRPGVDLNILMANLREHGSVRNFSTVVLSEVRPPQQAVVSAVSALHARVPCLGFVIRPMNVRLELVPGFVEPATPRSVDQLVELVGRVSLKDIVRESTDLIERMCIEAALKVSGDNRASAAQLLGLSRQGLYSKLRRHGLGDLDPGGTG